MARCLGRCSFPPASPPKRFAREISLEADRLEPRITEGQAEYVRRLVYRFRRQIPAGVVALAGDEAVAKLREEGRLP